MNLMQLPDEQNSKRQVSDENYKLQKENELWVIYPPGMGTQGRWVQTGGGGYAWWI